MLIQKYNEPIILRNPNNTIWTQFNYLCTPINHVGEDIQHHFKK
jgi:hypothetical protein